MRPLPVAYGQLPFREAWRAEALQMNSESSDLCGGFAQGRKLPARPAKPGDTN